MLEKTCTWAREAGRGTEEGNGSDEGVLGIADSRG